MSCFPIKHILFLLIFIPLLLPAQELSGLQIMEKALNKTSWQDMTAQVQLVLTNAGGQQRIRKIKMFSRKRSADESDMLMRFMAANWRLARVCAPPAREPRPARCRPKATVSQIAAGAALVELCPLAPPSRQLRALQA